MKKLDSRLTEIRDQQAKGQGSDPTLTKEAAKVKQELSTIPGKIRVEQIKMQSFVVSMEEESSPPKGASKTPKPDVSLPAHQ